MNGRTHTYRWAFLQRKMREMNEKRIFVNEHAHAGTKCDGENLKPARPPAATVKRFDFIV